MAATQFVSEELFRKVAQRREGVDRDVWSLDIIRRAFSWIRKNGVHLHLSMLYLRCRISCACSVVCAHSSHSCTLSSAQARGGFRALIRLTTCSTKRKARTALLGRSSEHGDRFFVQSFRKERIRYVVGSCALLLTADLMLQSPMCSCHHKPGSRQMYERCNLSYFACR